MGKGNESDTSWWMILFLFVVLPLAFTLGGVSIPVNPATQSDLNRPPNPEHSGHPRRG